MPKERMLGFEYTGVHGNEYDHWSRDSVHQDVVAKVRHDVEPKPMDSMLVECMYSYKCVHVCMCV